MEKTDARETEPYQIKINGSPSCNVKVKFCGLSRPVDIDYANALLPDYIGFVFAESRRRVTPEDALRLRERLDSRILSAGVFRNAGIGLIASLCGAGTVSVVQLHGGEGERYIAELKSRVKAPVIKVFSPERQRLRDTAADFVMFDGAEGGSGKTFDWSLIERPAKPFFLAGGLTPGNVAEAIRRTKPFAVDVSGGVETDGAKDFEKMKKFMEEAKGVRL